MSAWANYFVTTLYATTKDGHLDADQLRATIEAHNGSEAYHCAYDLEPRADFRDYSGLMRPALGYVWFDFDSHDGGIAALADTSAFCRWLDIPDLVVCYSGSKGFHVGVPFNYFGLAARTDLGEILNRGAQQLKTQYKTIDTTIYNANRKFRALNSSHPKTGLFKIWIKDFQYDETGPEYLAEIQAQAKEPGDLFPAPEIGQPPLDRLTKLFHVEHVEVLRDSASAKQPVSANKIWKSPSGAAAFEKCGFLEHCKENQTEVTEPQWYAALSIVSRFQEGRKQCHAISYKHRTYSVSECNDKIDQSLQEAGPRTCQNISTLWDGCSRCPLYQKINSPVNIFERRFYISNVNKQGKETLIPDYNSLLECFQDDSAYKTIADMKSVYRFNGTHYEEFTPIEIKAFAEESFEPKPKETYRQEFYNKVLANSVERREFFNRTTLDRLNFKNGVLEVGAASKELQPHSSHYGFRHVLPYDYSPHAGFPTFKWWINDVMLGDEALVKILQEFMGYVVRGGEYKYHKALWLSGTGRNGKSTFLSVLKALIGAGNYSTLSIRQIINDKFSAADLDGKIANFSEETSPEELSDSGPFKNLTGDGELNAQKKYGDPYTFGNRAKLIMTYNEVPELRDLSPGMMSRPIIIPWKKDLTASELQDKNLKKKLIAELPGIFNFALEGWNRLEAQGDFTFSPESQIEMDKIKEASCTAMQWVNEWVTFLPAEEYEFMEVRQPHDLYDSYCQIEKRFPYKSVKFFRRISEHPEIKKRKRHTRNGNEYFSMRIKQKN